jgi:hypothetical protein
LRLAGDRGEADAFEQLEPARQPARIEPHGGGLVSRWQIKLQRHIEASQDEMSKGIHAGRIVPAG